MKSKTENILLTKKDYDITPTGMLNNAKDWDLIYRQNVLSKNHNLQITAIYCLLTAIEMYLKAYLILLDIKYSKTKELKKVGHNFIKMHEMYKDLNGRVPGDFTANIKELLKEYYIYIDDYSLLRYPKKGDKFKFHLDFFTGNHKFNIKFNLIEEKIKESLVCGIQER